MSRKIIEVPVSQLRARNVRSSFDPGKMAELAASIKAHGVKVPLLVRRVGPVGPVGQGYEIVAGERRWRAAKLAGLDRVPCLDEGELDERGRLIVQASENLGRADLTPLEEGRLFERLVKAGVKREEIEKEFGLSKTCVNDRRRLAAMPAGVLDLVEKGKLGITHAQCLVGLPEKEQVRLAKEAVRGGWAPGDLRGQVAGKGEGDNLFLVLEGAIADKLGCAAKCPRVVAGCYSCNWECPYEYRRKTPGPRPEDCEYRDPRNCREVLLCPDPECAEKKAAEQIRGAEAQAAKLPGKVVGREIFGRHSGRHHSVGSSMDEKGAVCREYGCGKKRGGTRKTAAGKPVKRTPAQLAQAKKEFARRRKVAELRKANRAELVAAFVARRPSEISEREYGRVWSNAHKAVLNRQEHVRVAALVLGVEAKGLKTRELGDAVDRAFRAVPARERLWALWVMAELEHHWTLEPKQLGDLARKVRGKKKGRTGQGWPKRAHGARLKHKK